MQQPDKQFSATLTVGAFASAMFHAVLFYLLLFGLPTWEMEAEPPEAIQVQLVQAADIASGNEEAGGAEEELQDAEEMQPAGEEQSSAEEELQPAEEEQPEAEDELQAAEEEQPQSAEEEEQSAEAEVQTADEVEQPLPTLRPVFQFGDEDAGPVESDVGEELSGTETAEAQTSEIPLGEADTPEQVIDALAAPDGEATALPKTEDPVEEPVETAASVRSLHNNDSETATTAVDDTTRRARAGILCASELQRALLASPWPPEIIPKYTLKEGTVLEESKAAFRSKALWYELQFRCEIDQDATRVIAFEYEVGSPIPEDEWAARGFPES